MLHTPSALEVYSPPPGHPFAVLLVDDNDFDRQRIKRISERTELTIHIHEAPSLAAMQDAVRRTKFELVLLDYQLADGDGLDALEILRGSELQSETGVIMITGNERTDVAVTAFRNGCSDFVSKSAMSPDVMRSAMLRTLGTVEEMRAQNRTRARFKEQIEGAVVESLSGARAQDAFREMVQTARGSAISDAELAHQIELQQIFKQMEEDDEFHFG
jgi:PleD family two-component response regulator